MKIVSIGGGPAGLYFSILMKKAHPDHQVVVYERNRLEDTFGFGVVFSDATGSNLETADPETFEAMQRHFASWDDIDIHYRGEVITSTGHAFSGMSRWTLLDILAGRCRDLPEQEAAALIALLPVFERSEVGGVLAGYQRPEARPGKSR